MEVIFVNQLRILACDGGYPKRTTTTKVNIHLQRNLDAPVFDRKIYNGTVLEQNRIGRPFTQVTATDSDTQVKSDIYECLILSLIHEAWHFLLNSIKFLLELDIFWFYDLIVNQFGVNLSWVKTVAYTEESFFYIMPFYFLFML